MNQKRITKIVFELDHDIETLSVRKAYFTVLGTNAAPFLRYFHKKMKGISLGSDMSSRLSGRNITLAIVVTNDPPSELVQFHQDVILVFISKYVADLDFFQCEENTLNWFGELLKDTCEKLSSQFGVTTTVITNTFKKIKNQGWRTREKIRGLAKMQSCKDNHEVWLEVSYNYSEALVMNTCNPAVVLERLILRNRDQDNLLDCEYILKHGDLASAEVKEHWAVNYEHVLEHPSHVPYFR